MGGYDQIGERTIPQIIAIKEHLPEEIRNKMVFPFGGIPLGSSADNEVLNPDRDISVSDIDSICSLFSGL
jgi:hypothetical protein